VTPRTSVLAVFLFVLVGVGCGSSPRAHSSPVIVPWVDRPLPLYVIPEAKPIRYPASAPRCRAAQLRVSQGRGGVGLGNELEELVFTNAGARPCLLRGYPKVTGETAAGMRAELHAQRGGTYFGRLLPSNVPPGGHVFLDFATSTGCDLGRKRAIRYRHLVFTLPQGGSVRGRVTISEVCGLGMSEFGLQERYAEPRAAPGTAGTLQARVRLPESVRAGSALRYVVILSNPTRTPLVLHHCPGYTEGLYASGLASRHSFALNCDSVSSIPAHGHARYAMKLKVPPRAPAGPAKLSWNVNTPTGPFAGGVVQVTAA
jgi:Domain of unknown function (DUF4232)